MYSPLYKRILILLSCFSLIVTVLTYNPTKSEAIAGTAAKIVATQTIKAATKSAVNETVQKLLVKELLEEVTETYAKKQGYKLIENAGQRMYIKATYTETEKALLKKQIDKVIDAEVYGNTPKFVKFLDWFVGVGAVIMVAQVMYATLTGDFGSYIMDIITKALTQLGWLETAVSNNAPTPDNPIPMPSDIPQNTTREYATTPTASFGSVRDIVIDNTTSSPILGFNVKTPKQMYNNGGLTIYSEIQPLSTEGIPTLPKLQSQYFDVSYISNSSVYTSGFSPMMGINDNLTSFYVDSDASSIELFVGGKLRYIDTTYTGSSRTINVRNYSSSFWSLYYNRYIYQHRKYDPLKNAYFSTLIMQDTYRKQYPDIYLRVYDKQSFTRGQTQVDFLKLTAQFYDPTTVFPLKLRLGVFNSLDLALSTDMLPAPKLDTTPLKIPILNTEGKIVLPQKTILPDGHTYDPTTQEIKDSTGNTVSDPTVLDLPVPDPQVKTTPDGVTVDDTPVDLPPPPADGEPPTDEPEPPPDESKPEDIDWKKLKQIPTIFTTKFPFSLPWDVERFMTSLFGSVPVASDLKWEIPPLMGIDPDITITIPDYFDDWFAFGRTTVLVMFDISLVYAIYRLLGGAS